MSQIIYSNQTHLTRLSEFMSAIEPTQKKRVVLTLLDGIELLKRFPCIAKTSQAKEYKQMRALFIPFGRAVYSVLYPYKEEIDTVLIASIRHTKKSGYKINSWFIA